MELLLSRYIRNKSIVIVMAWLLFAMVGSHVAQLLYSQYDSGFFDSTHHHVYLAAPNASGLIQHATQRDETKLKMVVEYSDDTPTLVYYAPHNLGEYYLT